ncbi:MAG: glycosyltransferase [Magnetococcales bacterium]|nr:glycosyltransferase [Magnetococcales bacterium]
MPKVSIIVNCYNGERYLSDALDSIYSQTYNDWEIIFYDNQSNDHSRDIAARYDIRLKYFQSEMLIPLGAARASAVSYASGEWIAFLDTDDLWYPNKLEIQLKGLSSDQYIACYSGIREVTPDGKKIRDVYPLHQSGDILEGLLRQFDINMVTPMFRREIVSQYGLNFDPSITASEEYNLFIRIAAKGNILVQNILLGDYRVSTGSLTDRQISKWAYERRYTLDQLKSENPGIENKFPEAFREAKARSDYYEARYMMSEGRVNDAKLVMSGIKNHDKRYAFLYFTLQVPFLWDLIHSKFLRLMIIRYLRLILFNKSK